MRSVRPFGAALLVLSLGTVATSGCGNPTRALAVFPVSSDTLVAFSVNNSEPQQPSAFYLATNSLVVPDGMFMFDIAFNIDAAGNAVVLPAKLIGTVLGTPLVVGLQTMHTSFNSITIAEHVGYNFNDPDTVRVGQVFEVISRNTSACLQTTITSQQALYAKFVLDSVHPSEGKMFFRAVVDTNCDFDTLVPGVIPTH